MSMSLADDIVTILFSYSAGYKRLRELAYGSTRPRLRRSKRDVVYDEKETSSLRVTLYRLRKQGFVTKEGNRWKLTSQGRSYCEQLRINEERRQQRAVQRKRRKTMIVAFDVPEEHRLLRDWLRGELVDLGFEPIQKSVWFGPGPLPQDFIEELGSRDLLTYLKFFRANEQEIV